MTTDFYITPPSKDAPKWVLAWSLHGGKPDVKTSRWVRERWNDFGMWATLPDVPIRLLGVFEKRPRGRWDEEITRLRGKADR